jgi:hypothetical protein
MIFWKILLAHVLTDFVFQPDPLAENKEKVMVLFVHSLIFFLLSIVILLPTFSYQTIIALALLASFHGFIDYSKNLIQKRTGKSLWLYFLGDQALHVLGIGVVIFFLDINLLVKTFYISVWLPLCSDCIRRRLLHRNLMQGVLGRFGFREETWDRKSRTVYWNPGKEFGPDSGALWQDGIYRIYLCS